jgi:glycerol-3-phosphate dehydrogenase
VVNATGPWVQKLREADHSNFGKTLRLTKGVHLVFDQRRFPLHQAIYFDTADKRMMFAIPRDGKAYVGTTDTDYTGDIAHPTVTEEDITYILQATNDLFPMQQLTREDIESSWAGLRPLIYEEGKNPSEVSRRDEIFQSDSGLITIAGGKLTGYRKMGEHVTDLLARRRVKAGLARKIAPCVTKTLRLSGGDFPGGAARMPDYLAVSAQKLMKRNIPHAEARMLAHRYGTNVDALLEYIDTAPQEEAQRYGLPVGLYATVRYSIEHEMAQTPLDFFLRRTGALLFNVHWTVQWKSAVCTAMAALLHYSAEQRQLYEHELLTALTEAVPHDF